MNPSLSVETEINLAQRLTIGLVLGAIIGFERELHRQPAGFRTHSLVFVGSRPLHWGERLWLRGVDGDPHRRTDRVPR